MGDNVFIGAGTIVLPSVTIGDHVIIGAGSVVASDIPSDSVAAGVPAKVICSLEEYYQRNEQRGRFYETEGMTPKEKADFLRHTVK